jgi:Rrf2 family protein
MKISKRSRYGILLMIDLATHRDEDLDTLSTMAARQNISMHYLEQVAIILRNAGFIRSVKGSAGGYSLTMECENITVGAILRALEGDMLILEPPARGVRESKLRRCIREAVFEPLNERIAAIIDGKTLADLAAIQNNPEMYVFYI